MDTDLEYVRLRAAGLSGWGGESYDRRLAGWVQTISRFEKWNEFPQPPARLLELGCGNGMASFVAAQMGYAVHGLDLSQEAVTWAQERFSAASLRGEFQQGNVCAMPIFGEGMFEIVLDGNCLHCIIGEDRRRCLREVRRVLRRQGVFVVSSMCGTPKSDEIRQRYVEQARCLYLNGSPHRTLKPPEEIEQEVADAGFRVLGSEVSTNTWWDHLTLIAAS